jgi:hypothetical protein
LFNPILLLFVANGLEVEGESRIARTTRVERGRGQSDESPFGDFKRKVCFAVGVWPVVLGSFC